MIQRKRTTEDFVERAKKVHGDRYLYCKTLYVGSKSNVIVTCKEHGDFTVRADHFLQGHGCSLCGFSHRKKRARDERKMVYGVGINDMVRPYNEKFYNIWVSMLARCYSQREQKRSPTYRGCFVCDEWLYFSSFYRFCMENYIDGYCLDKDILSPKRKKKYGPDTCCFVPQEINAMLTNNKKRRGGLPIGVQNNRYVDSRYPYISEMRQYGKRIRIGTFASVESAFSAYKKAKEDYVKKVAQEYYDRGKITKRVYDALMHYEVEITD